MSLPVMLLPLESESLPGFLMRVSQRNVVPNSIQLLRSFGLRPRVAYGDDELVTMAKQLSIETEQLSRITTSLVSHNPLLRVKFQRKGQMICPACLREGGYLRQAWLHDLVCVCPYHRVALIGSCPTCDEPLAPTRGRVEVCDCGQVLADVSASEATKAELAVAALLEGVSHPARRLLPLSWQDGPPPSDIAEFLEFLAAHLGCPGEAKNDKPRKAARPKTLVESRERVVRLWPLLADWPQGFTAAIDQRLQQTEGPGLAKRLGSWHGMLHRKFSSSAYDFVREALAQHVAANFDGHLNQRLSTIDPKHVGEKCWLSPAEAGRFIGIGAELLRAAVLSGEVKGKLSVAGANRFVSLHRDEAEKIRRNRLAYLTATEARNQLGASKGLFERLLQAGALPRYSKQQRPPLVSAEFREKDIVALINRLSAYLQVRDVQVEQQLGLHDLSARHGLTPDQISSVLQQILDGRLRPVGHKTDQPGVAGLRYDRHQIEAVLVDSVEEAREPTLLITDLVRMQGWKHEVILGWINAGLLNTAVEQRGRQVVTVIPVSSLLNFLSRYLVLADAAQRVGSKSNWMLRGLMPAGVSAVGAAALPGGGQRGVLLEIDAVLRAAQWNKRTAERAFTGAA
ncbi:TniQ family protein [Pseudomonas sp. CCOS 191]|uniref:TniQ family protein n=1 Tax=Pseudomonas sp. CCOS 191 TaxID=1649877 RepID=UPI0018E6CA85|nr:TniQ family protein [Pseudomonas sp. CCOS 191]MBI6951874.1 TniQ family protein [Pseudomonas sp. CCOS 191]